MSHTESPEADVRAHLLPLSGLLAHKAMGRPGPLGLVGRAVRKLAKALIRPWLDFQTRFNHAVVEQSVQLHDAQRHQAAAAAAVLALAEATAEGVRQRVQTLVDQQAAVAAVRARVLVLSDRNAVADATAADDLAVATAARAELMAAVELLTVRLAVVAGQVAAAERRLKAVEERVGAEGGRDR